MVILGILKQSSNPISVNVVVGANIWIIVFDSHWLWFLLGQTPFLHHTHSEPGCASSSLRCSKEVRQANRSRIWPQSFVWCRNRQLSPEIKLLFFIVSEAGYHWILKTLRKRFRLVFNSNYLMNELLEIMLFLQPSVFLIDFLLLDSNPWCISKCFYRKHNHLACFHILY